MKLFDFKILENSQIQTVAKIASKPIYVSAEYKIAEMNRIA